MEFANLNDPTADGWSIALAVIVDSGAKGGILMVLAWLLVALFMRRSSPARRHLVWSLSLGALLLLPILSLIVPSLHLPILPGQMGAVSQPEASPLDSAVPGDMRTSVQSAPVHVRPISGQSAAAAGEMTDDFFNPPAVSMSRSFWFVAGWLAVALFTLTPLLAGLIAVAALVRRARPFAGDEWVGVATSLSSAIGLRRRVRLLCAPSGAMPMATGLLRAIVLLPQEADEWADEKRRTVLLHELAHVKRWDCLTHALARLAVAFHWFNPLAWLVMRELRIERERACDDLVVTAGERPSLYAEHLLDIARKTQASPFASTAAVTMAEKSHLEGRLRALLDATRNRKAVRLGLLIAGILLVLAVAIPLSALKLSEARVFEKMTPEQKAEFDRWYTEKISIPEEELRVEPYDPSLLDAVHRFLSRWEQEKEFAREVEAGAEWMKLAEGRSLRLPDSFTDRHRKELEKLRPLLSAWKRMVLHPEYTIDALTAGNGPAFVPTREGTMRWAAVRTMARLMYADVLLHLERGRLDEAIEAADALVAGGQVDPYSTTVERMIAIAILRYGVAACHAIGEQPLEIAQREAMLAKLEARRSRLNAEASYTESLNALTWDHVGLTLKARRSGLMPDFHNKTGYEGMLEALRLQREYLEKVRLPQAVSQEEKKVVMQNLDEVRQQSRALEGRGGVKRILFQWTDPISAAVIFSTAMPALEKARANAAEVLEEYDRLQQELRETPGKSRDS